jgi:hypothetical protein
MQSVGLIKIINHDGSEGVICRTCLEGWTWVLRWLKKLFLLF